MHDVTHSDDALFYDCPTCGKFVVTTMDHVNFLSERQRVWEPHQLPALLRERSIRPLPPYWVRYGMDPYGPLDWRGDLTPIDVAELLAQWPRTVPERIDRLLCNLASLSKVGGQPIGIGPDDPVLAFAQTPDEAIYYVNSLKERKLLEDAGSHAQQTVVRVTTNGWERYEALTRGASSRENPVFAAMWFGVEKKTADRQMTYEEMKAVYDNGIAPAVRDAGYRVTRVDLVEHNEWIMDKVLADIRLAPMIVADFTGNRNGVYFEAGFARGLGIPVIHTCHSDHMKEAHFDTQQLNHVRWTTYAELRERLCNRIIGTVGRGPYSPDAQTV